MLKTLLVASALALSLSPSPAPVVHCQVPCGIYGDLMRVDMMLEDAATIEKGMKSITDLESKGGQANQLVRWIMTKDEHAQKVQELVAGYWLAQRIKKPSEDAGREKYLRQLELMHDVTVAAMKCKQTTDTANVEALRSALGSFGETYFSKEDREHLKEHHEGGR